MVCPLWKYFFVVVMFSDFKITPADLSQPLVPPCHVTEETEHSYSFLQAIWASPCITVNHGADYMQGQQRKGHRQTAWHATCFSLLELYLMINSLQ